MLANLIIAFFIMFSLSPSCKIPTKNKGRIDVMAFAIFVMEGMMDLWQGGLASDFKVEVQDLLPTK